VHLRTEKSKKKNLGGAPQAGARERAIQARTIRGKEQRNERTRATTAQTGQKEGPESLSQVVADDSREKPKTKGGGRGSDKKRGPYWESCEREDSGKKSQQMRANRRGRSKKHDNGKRKGAEGLTTPDERRDKE